MNYKFKRLKGIYSVCKLNNCAEIPDWIDKNNYYSITKTEDELSIICIQDNIPTEIQCEKDWEILKIDSVLDFSMVGVISEISSLLSGNNISIFVVSTFNTDYILVKKADFNKAVKILEENGNTFIE